MPTIKLVVQGLGEVPSFKNKKVIGRSRNGKAILYTKANVKDQMELFTRALEFQLRCLLQTKGIVMGTECIPPFKIASLLPADDSLAWIPNHSVSWRKVKRGEEGFEITIEPL